MKNLQRGALGALLSMGALLVGAGAASAAPVTAGPFAYNANAFGTYANAGNVIVSGRTSNIGLPCVAQPGSHYAATAAGINLVGLLRTGAVRTTVSTGPASGPVTARSTAVVAGASVLSGLIGARGITAVSSTSHTAGGYQFSSAGSSLVGLTVAGKKYALTPAPNTTVALTGVGRVVLNEQLRSSNSLTVNMIHVYVTKGLKAGTEIIVGHAFSGLPPRTTVPLSGVAYSSYARLGATLTSGPTFLVGLCGDTRGKVRTNTGAGINLPGVLTTGTATNTATGTATATTASGETKATIQHVKLAGLVTANGITADAHAAVNGATVSTSDSGSQFVNLVVNGKPISGDVPANTKITVGNITIWLHRVIKSSNAIVVRMIEVIVRGANPFGLVTGADIQVADAQIAGYPLG